MVFNLLPEPLLSLKGIIYDEEPCIASNTGWYQTSAKITASSTITATSSGVGMLPVSSDHAFISL